MYKRGAQFPYFSKQVNKDNTVEVVKDLVQHINERFSHQLEIEFSAIQKSQGGSDATIVQNYVSSGSGSSGTGTSKTRVTKQVITVGGNTTVVFSPPLSRTDYAVVTELLDSSNNRLLSVAFPSSQSVSGCTVYCQDAGFLTTIAIEP